MATSCLLRVRFRVCLSAAQGPGRLHSVFFETWKPNRFKIRVRTLFQKKKIRVRTF
jgi:hypothetical protein